MWKEWGTEKEEKDVDKRENIVDNNVGYDGEDKSDMRRNVEDQGIKGRQERGMSMALTKTDKTGEIRCTRDRSNARRTK